MPQIAPICPAICHVDVEHSHAKAPIILVEDALELLVGQGCAVVEAIATPWVEAAALELNDGIWCAWTLL